MIVQTKDIQVLIPAGGFGTRLRSVIQDVPKPMALIKNRPFLEWLIEFLKIQGLTNIVVLTGHQSEAIIHHFGDGSNFGVKITYSHEESPLGTGGSIAKAIKNSDYKDFLVLNGDTLFCIDINLFIKKSRAPITIALKSVEDTSRYGRVLLSDKNLVTEFQEKKAGFEYGLISAGIYYLQKEVQSYFKEASFSFEKDILEPLSQKSLVSGFLCSGEFIDIGIPSSYQEAQIKIPEWFNLFKETISL